jgi:hypothetical protein
VHSRDSRLATIVIVLIEKNYQLPSDEDHLLGQVGEHGCTRGHILLHRIDLIFLGDIYGFT